MAGDNPITRGSSIFWELDMNLSRKCIESLIDLVEIKLSSIEVSDREDVKAIAVLERCRRELMAIAAATDGAKVVSFPALGRASGKTEMGAL